jgi:hypothetical protein
VHDSTEEEDQQHCGELPDTPPHEREEDGAQHPLHSNGKSASKCKADPMIKG